MEEKDERIETHLLVVVLDASCGKKFASRTPSDAHNLMFKIFDSVIVFGNAHLMKSVHNKLAILGCNSQETKFFYPSESSSNGSQNNRPGQYDLFARIDANVRNGLGDLLLKDSAYQNGTKSDSLLGGAMARALYYIQRVQRELSISHKLMPRMLVVSGSSDSALQYMTFMEAFFTAQKENVVIDCCMMEEDSGLLQQGCDITGGQYLRIPNTAGLLEYLLWVFLPTPAIRAKLVLPPPTKVDYRAACFCHRKLVDIGWVCSVCLSVFCRWSVLCTTCGAHFKNNLLPAAAPVKPKKRAKVEHSLE